MAYSLRDLEVLADFGLVDSDDPAVAALRQKAAGRQGKLAVIAGTGAAQPRRWRAPWDENARGGRGGWRPWVQALRGRSGAYAIRRASDGEVLYVGSAATGRLYRTLIRHFEAWGRDKSFWRDAYDGEDGPGWTAARNRVEVAVRVCPPRDARALEAEMMRRLKPEVNEMSPAGEEVPF